MFFNYTDMLPFLHPELRELIFFKKYIFLFHSLEILVNILKHYREKRKSRKNTK